MLLLLLRVDTDTSEQVADGTDTENFSFVSLLPSIDGVAKFVLFCDQKLTIQNQIQIKKYRFLYSILELN